MFTSREYEFADITVYLGKRDVIGLRAIEYKEAQEKEALYGKGNKPVSIQKGNKSYDGKITPGMSRASPPMGVNSRER